MVSVVIWLGSGFSTKRQDSPPGVGFHEAVGRGVRDRGQDQGCGRSRGLVGRDHGGEVDVRQHVTVQDDRPLVEEIEGVSDRAARAEGVSSTA